MPLFRSPFTDMFGVFGYSQSNPKCRDFELNMVECLEAHGLHRGSCNDEVDDYRECLFGKKQMARVMAMKKERERQEKAGELSPSERPKPPHLESFSTFPK